MITLEFNEISLSPEKIYIFDSYPKEGLYVVNDGITWCIASVFSGGVAQILLPNKQIIDSYLSDKEEKVKEDLLGKIDYKLDALAKYIESRVQKTTSSSIDLSELTRLVAVSQDPKLIKD